MQDGGAEFTLTLRRAERSVIDALDDARTMRDAELTPAET
jgi:hypothetical protein